LKIPRRLADYKLSQRNKLIQNYAIRFAITSNHKSQLEDMFPFAIEGYEEYKISKKEFCKINNTFRFPIQLVNKLNSRYKKMVQQTGRIVCTDEKHKEIQIGWKHSRFAKQKNGHWTYNNLPVNEVY
jgi:hypothetical protein